MKSKTFYLLSLGCAKNTVDSNSMAELLQKSGYEPVQKPAQANILLVNTCGFIQAARDESITELRKLAKRKREGQYLIAAGCLPDRYRHWIAEQVPGVDGILSTKRWMDIVDLVRDLRRGLAPAARYELPETETVGTDEHGTLRAAIQGASAYLKIADGCRRPCAFCSIPLIKGGLVSRPAARITQEAKLLQNYGLKELILIAQDTTDYGFDLGLKDGLPDLLQQMLPQIPDIPWVRIMYAFPGHVSDRLIDLMAGSKQILPYLDIPLQHAHPETLRRMRRPADMEWVRRTIEKMRIAIPNLAIRTTFIVGYPGETEEEFTTLLDFLREMKFDRAGAFPYSFEPGTASEQYGDTIPEEVKTERLDRLMTLQAQISLSRNQSWVGKTLQVLIEGEQDGLLVGRSYRDAPEIDGLVLCEGSAAMGEIVPVQITGAMTYDLNGILNKK